MSIYLSTHYAPNPFRFYQIYIFWFRSYPRGRVKSVCTCLRNSNSIYCLFTLWMCCRLILHWIIFHALGRPIKSYLKWTARNSWKNNNILKNSNYLTFTLAFRPNAGTWTRHLLKRLHEWTRTELNCWKNYFEKFAQGGPSFTWISRELCLIMANAWNVWKRANGQQRQATHLMQDSKHEPSQTNELELSIKWMKFMGVFSSAAGHRVEIAKAKCNLNVK